MNFEPHKVKRDKLWSEKYQIVQAQMNICCYKVKDIEPYKLK